MFNFAKNIIQQITLSMLQETLRVYFVKENFSVFIILIIFLEPCILEQKSY